MKARIHLSVNGELVGEVDGFNADRYVEASNNPHGLVQAEWVLDPDDLAKLGLIGCETVYAIEV